MTLSKNEKIREWWIQNVSEYEDEWGQVIVSTDLKLIEKDFKKYGKVHVIEYSAYEALQIELERAKFILAMIATEEFCEEFDHYKPMAEEWLKSLEEK